MIVFVNHSLRPEFLVLKRLDAINECLILIFQVFSIHIQ
jgi:hypothetical protein